LLWLVGVINKMASLIDVQFAGEPSRIEGVPGAGSRRCLTKSGVPGEKSKMHRKSRATCKPSPISSWPNDY